MKKEIHDSNNEIVKIKSILNIVQSESLIKQFSNEELLSEAKKSLKSIESLLEKYLLIQK